MTTVIPPAMLLLEAGDDAFVETLLKNDDWVVEQKHDGTRVMVAIHTDGTVTFHQRNGGILGHTAATQWRKQITSALSAVPRGTILDGELMIADGEYRVFDIPSRQAPFRDRRSHLERLAVLFQPGVTLVAQAVGQDAKRAMLQAAQDSGVEGIVFKAVDGPYEHGRRSPFMRKHKFVKTADVVVTKVDRRRNAAGREIGSIEFGLSDSKWKGCCSVIGKPHIEPGDVIEIAYLYWTGGCVYQPRMIRRRPDKTPDECSIEQFRPYSREAVTA